MKNFFKSKLNLTITVFLGLAVLFAIIALVVNELIIGCLICICVDCFLIAAVFIKRYQRVKELRKDMQINGQIVDGTEFGYDEDVYLIPDDNKKVIKKKISLSVDSAAPAALFIIIGLIILGMTIRFFFL